MPMTPKQMIKLLESNGFRQTHSNGSHFFSGMTKRTEPLPFRFTQKTLKKEQKTKYSKTQGLNKSCKGGFYE